MINLISSLKLFKYVILLLIFSDVILNCLARRRPECTLTIHRNTQEHSDQNFFNRVENFFQRHAIARVLALFLNKGYLVVGMRFLIKVHRARPLLLPDYLLLKTTTGLHGQYFSNEIRTQGLDEAIFLKSVRNAFRDTYYKRTGNVIPPEGRFIKMLDDALIRAYFQNINIQPVIMYVESNITYRGLSLYHVEISARDKDICFLDSNKRSTSPTICLADEEPPNKKGAARRRSMSIIEVRADKLYTTAQEMIDKKLKVYSNTTMWSTVENSFDISSHGVEYYLIEPLVKIVFNYIKEKADQMVKHAVQTKCKDTLNNLKHKTQSDADLLLGDVSFLLKPIDNKEYEKIAQKFSVVTMSFLRQFVERSSSLLAAIFWSHATNADLSTQRKIMEIETCLKKNSSDASARNATEHMTVLYSLMLNSSSCAA